MRKAGLSQSLSCNCWCGMQAGTQDAEVGRVERACDEARPPFQVLSYFDTFIVARGEGRNGRYAPAPFCIGQPPPPKATGRGRRPTELEASDKVLTGSLIKFASLAP